MRLIGEALARVAAEAEVEFVVPLHVNSRARSEMFEATAGLPNIRLLEPQGFRAMISLMLQSRCILTDSGGLQEEGAALGRPVLILRSTTERPEVVESGNARLVGTDPARIAAETLRLLRDDTAHARMSRPAFPFGKGGAAPVIAESVVSFLKHRN